MPPDAPDTRALATLVAVLILAELVIVLCVLRLLGWVGG